VFCQNKIYIIPILLLSLTLGCSRNSDKIQDCADFMRVMSDLRVLNKAFYPEKVSDLNVSDIEKENIKKLLKEGADFIQDAWENHYVDNGVLFYSKGKNQKDNHGKMDDIVFGIHDNKTLYCDNN